ncbi:MAG: hypothetical protein WBM76_07695 [Woeseiaceae bacterium]
MRTLQATLLAALLLIAASAYARDSIVTKESIPGATLHIEVRQPVTKHKAAEIIEWLRSTSTHISLAYGRFPNPSPHVVVIPTQDRAWGSDSPVPFGRVTRNGEERIELYVDAERPIEEYYDDWTATHEFSHLMLPYVGERHRWISEGFASYYQNVLMSRAGRYSEKQAWQKLYSGFERGRLSRPDLTLNEAASAGVRQARMKIYWSGAAIALLADIELRERSGGHESLDVVLDRLQQCCLPSQRTWSGPELFAQLDALLDGAVFMPLYERYANRSGFPDFAPALERIGVDTDDDTVSLRRNAELGNIRDAITGRRVL